MKLLLDTHVWLWQGIDTKRLGRRTLHALEDAKNELFISIVSIWELAIKDEIGKLELPVELQLFVRTMLNGSGTSMLSLTPNHVFELKSLERLHRDPFDRMMVAQARVENMTLVTVDERLLKYPVRALDART